MSVFRFRMQNILDMKTKLEEQAKTEFAQAQQKLLEEQELLAQIIKRKEDYIAYGIELRNQVIDVREILDNKKAIEYTKDLEKQQQLAVNVAQKAVDAASRKMMEARTQTKTYEKLKEHAFEEFLQEENRAESKEIDQLNSYRSARSAR
ncbi:MAG: flagellar export protein FliJ [Lachnospiraceae bacterium]|nr:flagellar export protein FliJ [Lachnospiraceae bacterium]